MARYIIRFLLLIMMCSVAVVLHARQTPMIPYTIKDGLPSNNVYNVMKDHQGFLWFTTNKGVARFNGISFETFTMTDGLPDDDIFYTLEDYEHRIWMATYNGKLCFYKEGKFYSEKNCRFLKISKDLFMHSNYYLQQDSSIVITGSEYLINIKGTRVTLVNLKTITAGEVNVLPVKLNENRYSLQFSDKKVIIDTLSNITGIKKNRNNRKYYHFTGPYNYFMMGDDSCLYNSSEQRLTGKIQLPHTPWALLYSPYLYKIHSDGQRYFFCMGNGLLSDKQDTLLKGKFITGMCSDNNGDYWVTTMNEGVFYIRNLQRGYVTYPNVYADEQERFQQYNGQLYFRDSSLHHLLAFSKGVVRKYPTPSSSFTKLSFFHVVNEKKIVFFDKVTPDKFILSIAGQHKRLLLQIDTIPVHTSKMYSPAGDYLYGFRSHIAYGMHVDSFINDHNSLKFLWHGKRGRHSRIMCSAEDRYNKSAWFSTVDSVYQVKDNNITAIKGIIQPFRNFFCYGKYMVGCDVNHTIYIYTTNPTGSVHLIRSFQDNEATWERFYPVTTGKVIVATNNYYRVVTFLPNDSIRIHPLEDPFIPRNASFIYGDSSDCYFLTEGNITSVPLKNLNNRNESPTVFFTGLNSELHSYTIQPSISIPHQESANIHLSFIAISFNSKDVSFQYSISNDAETDNWVTITGNSINVSAPGSGTMYIKLRAKGLSGDYSKPVMLQLTILQPFWLTWWFIVLLALISLLLVVIITRSIFLVILNRKRKLHDLESKYRSAEYKTLNALMNPHFIFNSLNNIKGLMNRDDKKTANKFLNSFSNVIRQNMQNLSKEVVSLEEEIELVSRYLELEKLRFGDIINYEVNIEMDIDLEELLIPPLLIQPLAENAVKHGLIPKKSADGLISVKIYEKQQSVFIEIKDNGVGLHNSGYSAHEGYESLGLSNIEKRLSYLRQSGKQKIFFDIRQDKNYKEEITGTIATIEIQPIN